MPSFAQRSYQKELLDRDDIPFEDIKRNMQELEIINKRLGGHSITIAGFKKLVGNDLTRYTKSNPLTIGEIGCGGGDNLKAIKKYCDSKNIPTSFIGIDINKDCIAYAKQQSGSYLNAEWLVSDYKQVKFEKKPDILFSSLFCHHFLEEELKTQLRWMKDNSSMGFFINDLHRHSLAYYSIKTLTRLFSKSYLVKNDAPVSVTRGFTRDEWQQIINSAEIHKFELEWKWAFRWLITVRNY